MKDIHTFVSALIYKSFVDCLKLMEGGFQKEQLEFVPAHQGFKAENTQRTLTVWPSPKEMVSM